MPVLTICPETAGSDIIGILLAGGQSRRMGGGDKAFAQLGGHTMLQHVIARFRPQVNTLAINANGDPARFATYNLSVFPDTIGDHPGPLAGILAGMLWAKATIPEASWIATVPIDVPLFPLDLIAGLSKASYADKAVPVIARSNGCVHPVVGLWPLDLSDDLAEALHGGVRKVQHWTGRHTVTAVDFSAVEIAGRFVDPFFNVNTPQDLADVRTLLAATACRQER